jgi:hypothetical protein
MCLLWYVFVVIFIINTIFDEGSAYVFQSSDRSGNKWTQVAQLLASDGAEYDNFGWSISIYNNLIAVGAYYDDTLFGVKDAGKK